MAKWTKERQNEYWNRVKDRYNRQRRFRYRIDLVWRKEKHRKRLEWNRLNAETAKIHDAARSAVKRAVREGRLIPLPCAVCGALAQAHHPDYTRPLFVEWLCVQHHLELHNRSR
jgi:hypothetical protein